MKGASVLITRIDRSNDHLFQPLLYQVATAGLSAPAIAAPVRHIFRHQRNVTVLMAEARAVDVQRRCVVLDDQSELVYDFLIVATGATDSYFGNDDWAAHAPGLKTLDDALEIRRRVLRGGQRRQGELKGAPDGICPVAPQSVQTSSPGGWRPGSSRWLPKDDLGLRRANAYNVKANC